MFTHGANLLSGMFANAFITGVVGGIAGTLQGEINTTGPITFTSDFLLFQSHAAATRSARPARGRSGPWFLATPYCAAPRRCRPR
jgi:hypothetical protein